MQIARYFLDSFQSCTRSQEQLCQAIRHIILPLLDHALQQTPPEPVLDAALVQGMVAHMFDPPEEQVGTLRAQCVKSLWEDRLLQLSAVS